MTTAVEGLVGGRPFGRGVGLGRVFVGALFDYMLVGGGLSLLVLASYWLTPAAPFWIAVRENLWTLVLLSNSAHFAGSTVRLYTKEGTLRDLPFVTHVLPLLMLALLGIGLVWTPAGAAFVNVYLLWSPFHYAAQTYGLSVMYACRSGRVPSLEERRWLRFACLLPFAHAALGGLVDFLVPAPLAAWSLLPAVRAQAQALLAPAAVLVPVGVLGWMARRGNRPVPAILPVLLLSNAVWLVFAGYAGAFAIGLVTVFHGLQYLAILGVFHVRERIARPDPAHPWWWHASGFYLVCLALGYVLFQAWPAGLEFFGATHAESVLLVAAVVNVHHFVVDGYIWKLRQDRNYAIVSAGATAP